MYIIIGAQLLLKQMTPKLSLNKSLVVITIASMILTFVPILSGSFLNSFISFLDYTGMLLGPIIAIMVVDYFILNKDSYNQTALSDINGKLWYHDGFNLIAIVSLVVGVLIYLALKQVGFIKDFTGATFITMGIVAVLYLGASKIFHK